MNTDPTDATTEPQDAAEATVAESAVAAADSPAPTDAPPPVSAPSPVPAGSSGGVIDSVELDVAVELGNVALSIGELLRLGEGSVVTLAQTVGEDVVMLANGTPVASGEVVVVDGTLGFRVSTLITDGRGA
jgi:flagellar motor switch protein FliN/FliY